VGEVVNFDDARRARDNRRAVCLVCQVLNLVFIGAVIGLAIGGALLLARKAA